MNKQVSRFVLSPIVCFVIPLFVLVLLYNAADQHCNLCLKFFVSLVGDLECFRGLFESSEANFSASLRLSTRTNHLPLSSDQVSQYKVCIWPEDCPELPSEDRIINQLKLSQQTDKVLKILPPDFSYPEGQEIFLKEKCNVNKCQITYDRDKADLLIFQNSDVFKEPSRERRVDQVWVAYFLESPVHTFDKKFKRLHRGVHVFNWTASYRTDSDIVTPYSKFVLSEQDDNRLSIEPDEAEKFFILAPDDHKSLIKNKSNKVAWLVSNCNAANNRLEYAKELSKHISVDIYGKCGNLTCDKWNHTGCSEMINKNYKFYLAFENSNCHQYITEKLFKNALGLNEPDFLVVPIVMGARKEEYDKFAPPNSFIHVDDFKSAKDLAEYLRLLANNDALYYDYFRWKNLGFFIDTKFMCRICAMLHNSLISSKRKTYPAISEWWNKFRLNNKSLVEDCDT